MTAGWAEPGTEDSSPHPFSASRSLRDRQKAPQAEEPGPGPRTAVVGQRSRAAPRPTQASARTRGVCTQGRCDFPDLPVTPRREGDLGSRLLVNRHFTLHVRWHTIPAFFVTDTDTTVYHGKAPDVSPLQ